MCSRKTVKLIQKLSAREELRAPVQRLALSSEKQAGVWNSLLLEQSKFSIIDVATVKATIRLRFGSVNHYL